MHVILQVEQLSKRFGELALFEGISFGIEASSKVALVARNGRGKSTLLNIIAGKETADGGSVTFRNDVSVGYLEQEPRLEAGKTVFEEVAGAIERLETLTDARGAWNRESKVEEILSRLEIGRRDRLVGELSGGQRKRVGLAKVLINEPDFLIMDEPTNHLDAEMVEWLEEYLERSRATLLMVTHDRYFLDRVCDAIIEIDDNGLFTYNGNYSYYLEKREERIAAREAAADRARGLLRVEREWMRRMPRARGHKSRARVEGFRELEEEVAARRVDERALQLNARGRRLGAKILEMKRVSKRYGDTRLLDDFSYTFSRGEKVGIVGRNGVGKTTFMELLAGETLPDSGTVERGATVVFGYYTQAGIAFRDTDRPIDIVREIAEFVHLDDGSVAPAARFLERFLFTDKLQYTPVGKLSGGERRRLHLLTVLAREPNFLILDEPTNDLDLATLNVLEEYARGFRGSLVVASHDRFFTDKIVDHLFVFEGEGRVRDFPGNYSMYRETREAAREPKEKKPVATVNKVKEKKRRTFREQQEMEQLEADLNALNEEKRQLEEALNGGNLDAEALARDSRRLAGILEALDEMETRWLVLSDV